MVGRPGPPADLEKICVGGLRWSAPGQVPRPEAVADCGVTPLKAGPVSRPGRHAKRIRRKRSSVITHSARQDSPVRIGAPAPPCRGLGIFQPSRAPPLANRFYDSRKNTRIASWLPCQAVLSLRLQACQHDEISELLRLIESGTWPRQTFVAQPPAPGSPPFPDTTSTGHSLGGPLHAKSGNSAAGGGDAAAPGAGVGLPPQRWRGRGGMLRCTGLEGSPSPAFGPLVSARVRITNPRRPS